MSHLVEVVRLLIVASCLGYASIKDLKTRMVSDVVWLVMAAGALPAVFYELYAGSLPHTLFITSAGLCFLVGLAAHRIGLFGGADMIALWLIGLTLPTYPSWSTPMLGKAHSLLSLAVLNNTLALAATTVFYALVRNLAYKARGKPLFKNIEAPARSKLLALFTGFKVEASRLSSKSRVFLVEEVRGGRRSLKISYLVRACEKAPMGISEEAKQLLQGDVWVTPALPLVAYMLAGLVVALIIGDLIMTMIAQLILATLP
ncbi:MAG: prepilin peptidase [Candidatus Nezhaarchaeota archaeon]|nr:prepilin peptidase [Candidatus Nezhaarchaeota archaeon]